MQWRSSTIMCGFLNTTKNNKIWLIVNKYISYILDKRVLLWYTSRSPSYLTNTLGKGSYIGN